MRRTMSIKDFTIDDSDQDVGHQVIREPPTDAKVGSALDGDLEDSDVEIVLALDG